MTKIENEGTFQMSHIDGISITVPWKIFLSVQSGHDLRQAHDPDESVRSEYRGRLVRRYLETQVKTNMRAHKAIAEYFLEDFSRFNFGFDLEDLRRNVEHFFNMPRDSKPGNPIVIVDNTAEDSAIPVYVTVEQPGPRSLVIQFRAGSRDHQFAQMLVGMGNASMFNVQVKVEGVPQYDQVLDVSELS